MSLFEEKGTWVHPRVGCPERVGGSWGERCWELGFKLGFERPVKNISVLCLPLPAGGSHCVHQLWCGGCLLLCHCGWGVRSTAHGEYSPCAPARPPSLDRVHTEVTPAPPHHDIVHTGVTLRPICPIGEPTGVQSVHQLTAGWLTGSAVRAAAAAAAAAVLWERDQNACRQGPRSFTGYVVSWHFHFCTLWPSSCKRFGITGALAWPFAGLYIA